LQVAQAEQAVREVLLDVLRSRGATLRLEERRLLGAIVRNLQRLILVLAGPSWVERNPVLIGAGVGPVTINWRTRIGRRRGDRQHRDRDADTKSAHAASGWLGVVEVLPRSS